MNLFNNLTGKLNLLNNTIYFFKKHLLIVVGLGLIAAMGRVIQLGGFGPITSTINNVMEVVIETSRILLFLYVLGLADVKRGVLRIKSLITNKGKRRASLIIAVQKVRKEWPSVLVNIIGFLTVAWGINYLIDLLAYETCLYLTLKKEGILIEGSSEWTILLFFKNLTVIPLTLIFDAVLLLWLSNKIASRKAMTPA